MFATRMTTLALKTLASLCLFLSLGAQPARGSAVTWDVVPDRWEDGVRWRRVGLLSGVGFSVRFIGMRYFDNTWYDGDKGDTIRWAYDWAGETYLNLDKGAHFMAGVTLAQSVGDGLRWSGVSDRKAAVIGSLVSWGALLEIEMRDAYYQEWGFSVPDFVANTVGAAVPLMYTLVPQTQNVQFKFGYFPSSLYWNRKERAAADRPRFNHLIDDYEGMTFWASMPVSPFLPSRMREYWPDFLGLALGYGATGLHGSNVKSKGPNKYYDDLPDASPEILLSLDYDTRYLPGDNEIWTYVKTRLNWIKFPAPAIRLYPSLRFYLLYL